ncbi:MAG: aminopeptidase [Gammaproteobacteria bacterium]
MLILCLQLAGCSPAYYWQAASGQLSIINGRDDIDELLEEATLEPDLRARLELALQALEFAHNELDLPDNGSYRSYYDTGRDYVVWNVFAAPEFSLDPVSWCFPVAGCVTYKGYFAEQGAQKYAAKLAAKGNDVFVAGVPAYSTLGRFKDPVLNTMLTMPEAAFVGLLFHELSHQQLYVKDDTAFNEGYAEAVEYIGLQRWEAVTGMQSDQRFERQLEDVRALLLTTRSGLQALYADSTDTESMRAAKAAMLAEARENYREMVSNWQAQGLSYRPYQSMVTSGLNNASLSAIATYADYRPAFLQLYNECATDLQCFYARAEELADLAPELREQQLEKLLKN